MNWTRRFSLLFLVIGTLSNCSSLSPTSSHSSYSLPPQIPEPPKLQTLTETQRYEFEQKILHLQTTQQLPDEIASYKITSAIDSFHLAHATAQYLFDQNEFAACVDFVEWVQHTLFHPPASHSFQLIKTLAYYRTDGDWSQLRHRFQTTPLALEHTPFVEALLFLTVGLPILARSDNVPLALSILDQVFAVYGSADIIFEKIQEAYLYSPLQSELILANHHQYSSPALAGLIYAEQILAWYDQLRFSDVTRHGSQFLRLFPQHRFTQKVSELVLLAQQKIIPAQPGFKIALLLPLTGPHAEAGKDIMDGIFHTCNVFEPDPSKLNKLITFFPIDTYHHVHNLVETTDQLISRENIFLIIGPYLAQNHLALEPISVKHHIPLLSLAPVEQNQDPIDTNHPVLSLRPALEYQLKFMMSYLSNVFHAIEHVAVLYPKNNFGSFHASAMQKAAESSQKTLHTAEAYDVGNEKTYRDAVERLLGLFDLQDRKQERETLLQAYTVKNGRPPPVSNPLTLPPILDFELLYIPSPLKDASVLVPLFKYFDAQRVLILGSATWNASEMIMRTRPYLGNVILFDTFYENETDPRYRALAQGFKQKYQKEFNRNHFWGHLVAEVVLKTLARLEPQLATQRDEFLEQIQKVEGRTVFGQSWQITPSGSLNLDPIPLAFYQKNFLRLTEEIIAKIKETVFPIKVPEELTDKVLQGGNVTSSLKK